ncbi:Signal recognition particle subunit SRP72, partial [Teratosphaeriaceae sp. CCFEE 6253]
RLVAKGIDSRDADHPFEFQTSLLRQNKHAVDLESLKFDGTAKSTTEILTKQRAPTVDAYYNTLSVANAAAHAKSGTGKQALQHILPLLDRRPNDVGLILTVVQLYVLTGNSGSAITLLETFLHRLEQSSEGAESEVRFAPGLIAVMVSLYHSAGRRGNVRTEYAKAAHHWRRKGKERPSGVVNLLKAAGSSLLESPEPEHQQLAKEILAELHEADESDRYSAAGLLAASPDSPPPSTPTSTLQPIDRLISTIDTDALESAGIPHPPTTTAQPRKRPAPDTASPTKSKKIRPSRLPKDYDPSKPPDPERWLPLRDRSTYRPKGKKGKAKQNLLSQGSAPTPADSDGSRPGTPAASEVVKGKQVGGVGKGKKKGKR